MQHFLRTIIQQKATERSYIKKKGDNGVDDKWWRRKIIIIQIVTNIQSSTELCRQHHFSII